MDHLTKDDLAQIDRTYLQNLEKETLIDVACKLRDFSISLVERLEQNSSNSSKPPSSDSPYDKGNKGKSDSKDDDAKSLSAEDKENKTTEKDSSTENSQSDASNRSPGRQPDSQGFWRSETPVSESTIPHYPSVCVICGKGLDVSEESQPYMGYYVYELEKTASGIRIFCTLHHYYSAVCHCGHETKAQPGEGCISHVEGRKKDLKLTEYTMVGPMLATFIAALSVRFRMSRRVRAMKHCPYFVQVYSHTRPFALQVTT
jgi:hypothetical protein